MATVEIKLKSTGETIAKGKTGWPITPFEGNYYVQKKLITSGKFVPNYIPGLCPYKFLYVWMDYITDAGKKIESLGWMYFIANPIFPFIWFRIGIPQNHPEIEIIKSEEKP